MCALGTPGGQTQQSKPLDGVGKSDGAAMVCVRMYVHAHTGVQKSASASASATAWDIPRNGDYYCSQLQGPFMDRVNS